MKILDRRYFLFSIIFVIATLVLAQDAFLWLVKSENDFEIIVIGLFAALMSYGAFRTKRIVIDAILIKCVFLAIAAWTMFSGLDESGMTTQAKLKWCLGIDSIALAYVAAYVTQRRLLKKLA